MKQVINRHFRLLEMAKQAFELGARCNVVETITGLSRGELSRTFQSVPQMHANHGGMPSSANWFLNDNNHVIGVHVAHFYAYFFHQFERGISPLEALIVAYQRYFSRYAYDPRLAFDRAFLLITCVHRLWTMSAPTLEAVRCTECRSLFIGALGSSVVLHHNCPLCKLSKEFEKNVRIRGPLTNPILAELMSLVEIEPVPSRYH
jgi:hypothetical protein